jgi:hypothetical protein
MNNHCVITIHISHVMNCETSNSLIKSKALSQPLWNAR